MLSFQAHLSFWVLTYWIFEGPLWLWVSMLTAYLGSFALFIFLAYISFHHMIATFPSFLYLFSHPPIPKIAKKEALHPASGVLLTVTPERPFVIIILEVLKRHIEYLGLDGRRKRRKFARLQFLICASMCCVCVVPNSTKKQRLTAVKHVIHCMRIIRDLSTHVQFTFIQSCATKTLMSCLTGDIISEHQCSDWE